MRDLSLLVWLTQLGFSTAFPLAGFVLLARWLQTNWGWGSWTLWVGILLGLTSAISGFRHSLQAMERMSKGSKKQDPPPVSFNEHN